jgi:putative two-component system response regulator
VQPNTQSVAANPAIRRRDSLTWTGPSAERPIPAPPPVWTPSWSIEPLAAEGASAILIVNGRSGDAASLRSLMEHDGNRLLHADDAEMAFGLVAGGLVDLVIVELDGPQLDAIELCRKLKSHRRTQFIPVVLLSAGSEFPRKAEGIESGADEFLIPPLDMPLVRKRLRAMLRHKAAIDSLEDAESVLLALALAVERRDKATHRHCERLAGLSTALGAALGLPRSQLVALYRGGFLHDIGKIGVPDSILFKPGKLNDAEWGIMRAHPTIGVEICREAKTLAPVLPIIGSHHERWDGSGYPQGLRGEEIPLTARILQVADVYDALTSVRPYKPAWPISDALDTLEHEARCGWRQPHLVALLRRLIEHPKDVLPLPASEASDTTEALVELSKALLER